MSHLLEMRRRLMHAVFAVVIIFVGLLPFANQLYSWLAKPLLE
ncbi:MAG: twin-arginine translocase subunit TatC, partial [Arenimonas sp.]|nr:twin-arginine translocase subunit TatC [Arenimonas sp.]